MPEYGSASYWDQRYEETQSDPFDWLFSFADLKDLIHVLIPDKTTKCLLIGCGNAPFSVDMYEDGYRNILNTDYSEVVINQQRAKYPHMQWEVMDAMDMKTFGDGEVPVVIDKSLVDTLLCYKNSQSSLSKMVDEMYRILSPNDGRYITFSLHAIKDVESYFLCPHGQSASDCDQTISRVDSFSSVRYDWSVGSFNVRTTRWDASKANRRKAVSHAMIVCRKELFAKDDIKTSALEENVRLVDQVLSDEEYHTLRDHAQQVNDLSALQDASLPSLRLALDRALNFYAIAQARRKKRAIRARLKNEGAKGTQEPIKSDILETVSPIDTVETNDSDLLVTSQQSALMSHLKVCREEVEENRSENLNEASSLAA